MTRDAMDPRTNNPASADDLGVSPHCHRVELTSPDAPLPACSQKQLLAPSLERFRREAVRGVCETGRYRCPYFAWGQGPAIVFVPGLCDDALSFVLPIARLSTDFCCVAYDMPNGRDDGARLSSYRHSDLVDDLLALLDHLHFDQCVLFGSSFGASVALSAMHRNPGRFSRAILQGGFARRSLAWPEILLAAWARFWPWKLEKLPLRQLVLRETQAEPFEGREPAAWPYFLQRHGSAPMAAVAHRALMLNQLDLRPILPQIQQPVLLICGDRDPLVDKECERELLAGLPRVARAEIEHCGHLPQFTHPEALAEIVRKFLQSSGR